MSSKDILKLAERQTNGLLRPLIKASITSISKEMSLFFSAEKFGRPTINFRMEITSSVRQHLFTTASTPAVYKVLNEDLALLDMEMVARFHFDESSIHFIDFIDGRHRIFAAHLVFPDFFLEENSYVLCNLSNIPDYDEMRREGYLLSKKVALVDGCIIDIFAGYPPKISSVEASTHWKLKYGITKKTALKHLAKLRAHLFQSSKQMMSEHRASRLFGIEVLAKSQSSDFVTTMKETGNILALLGSESSTQRFEFSTCFTDDANTVKEHVQNSIVLLGVSIAETYPDLPPAKIITEIGRAAVQILRGLKHVAITKQGIGAFFASIGQISLERLDKCADKREQILHRALELCPFEEKMRTFIKGSLRCSLPLELNMEADQCSSGRRKRPLNSGPMEKSLALELNVTEPDKTTNAQSSSKHISLASRMIMQNNFDEPNSTGLPLCAAAAVLSSTPKLRTCESNRNNSVHMAKSVTKSTLSDTELASQKQSVRGRNQLLREQSSDLSSCSRDGENLDRQNVFFRFPRKLVKETREEAQKQNLGDGNHLPREQSSDVSSCSKDTVSQNPEPQNVFFRFSRKLVQETRAEVPVENPAISLGKRQVATRAGTRAGNRLKRQKENDISQRDQEGIIKNKVPILNNSSREKARCAFQSLNKANNELEKTLFRRLLVGDRFRIENMPRSVGISASVLIFADEPMFVAIAEVVRELQSANYVVAGIVAVASSAPIPDNLCIGFINVFNLSFQIEHESKSVRREALFVPRGKKWQGLRGVSCQVSRKNKDDLDQIFGLKYTMNELGDVKPRAVFVDMCMRNSGLAYQYWLRLKTRHTFVRLRSVEEEQNADINKHLEELRARILLYCTCGGHDVVSKENESSLNISMDPSFGTKDEDSMPFALNIGGVGDKLLGYALKRHTSLLIRRDLKNRELQFAADSEAMCTRGSTEDGIRPHCGVFITRTELEKLKKLGKQVTLLYPSGMLIDYKTKTRKYKEALSPFEMRDLYAAGLTHRKLYYYFDDDSLASYFNEGEQDEILLYPSYREERYLQRLYLEGPEVLSTSEMTLIRVEIAGHVLKRLKRRELYCSHCDSYELLTQYGSDYYGL